MSGSVDSDRNFEGDKSPKIPDLDQRMSVVMVAAPHPALLESGQLLDQCELRTQPRSGPGGQHRNRTSSGAFLHHGPTGVVAEATEKRSQADNRSVALKRLRLRLAVEIRTASLIDTPADETETAVRERFRGSTLRIAEGNDLRAAVLALLLNDLHASGGQPSAVAPLWETSTSAIVRLVKSHPPAFALLNQIRDHHGRRALK